ncbi:6343_t:CDS:2 [Dentiscutata erythropus]|uniref:6343_t:CDS:1 n=1 Tax=Dentiscutata erythropus TaxID=1348616 RepID=A0A9N9HV53_9GLOM|nr:6343_t:CDS:2 [Dentiscutata erythropus]
MQYVSGNQSDLVPDLPTPRTCTDNDTMLRMGVPYNIFDRGDFSAFYKDNYTGEPWIKIDTRMISNILSDSGQEPVFSGNPLDEDHPNNSFNPAQNPHDAGNSYLDLSNIHGVGDDVQNNLRTQVDGKLYLETYFGSGGAYNKNLTNVTAERMAPSPGKADVYPNLTPPSIRANDAMVSGDTRCSENIQLCIVTTLEHNWMTIAEYQQIIFNEYLPAVLGVKMGYDPNLRPETSSHFSGAAFRYGELIELHSDFHSPIIIQIASSLLANRMLRETAAEFYLIITTGLRNIPGGMNLFAIDIGREIKNVMKILKKTQLIITSNMTIVTGLQQIYKKVSNIDAIVGMFAEEKESPTTPLPPIIANIIMQEFIRKRSSDRFWYEGDAYTDEERSIIKKTAMRDIILRNTNVRNIQINPFKSPSIRINSKLDYRLSFE